MSNSGSGTGTPLPAGAVGASSYFPTWPASVVTLARYSQIIGYAEAAFWGVAKETNRNYACREIWTKQQRDTVARFLYEAQTDLENDINYPLQPTWVTDERPPTQTGVMLAKFAKLLKAGKRAVSTIQADAPVSHATDPATVGPLATSVTDSAEIRVYYPGTSQEIEPSQVVLSGGNLTLYIPRVRMVHPDVMDNPTTGLDYADTANFLDTVDVKRVYNDPTTAAELVWETDTTTDSSTQTTAAALTIQNAEIGQVNVNPTALPTLSVGQVHLIRVTLYYQAGVTPLPQKGEDAIVRLAHAKMPAEPCGCDGVRLVWKRDANVPQFLSRERLNCPYGLTDGAWVAYNYAQSMTAVRMGVWR